VLESLLAQGKHEPRDQLQRYFDWTRETAAPIPAELKRALAVWQWSKKVQAGSHDPKNLDPHTLARTLAAALYLAANAGAAIELAVEISRTTQQSPVVLDLCRVWCATFVDALNGTPAAALRARSGPAMSIVRTRQLKPAAKTIIESAHSVEPVVADDALAVTAYAFTRFAAARNFQEALLSCVAARATNTAAASLCGALAGAHLGIESIPVEWRAKLPDEPALRSLARHCLH
jgi:ADP-ribosyl-[dinitrogen reductase] hydrolase